MKRRYRYALNLFSIGLLFFSLYLNFVRKEGADNSATADNKNSVITTVPANPQTSTSPQVKNPSAKLVLK